MPCAIQQRAKNSTQAPGNTWASPGKPELPCCWHGSSPITVCILNFLSAKYQLRPALKRTVIAVFNRKYYYSPLSSLFLCPFSTGRNAEHDQNYQTVTLYNCKHYYFTQYCFLHWRENKKPSKFLNQPAPGSVLTWKLCVASRAGAAVCAELLPAALGAAAGAERCGAAPGTAASHCHTRALPCTDPQHSTTCHTAALQQPEPSSAFNSTGRSGIKIAISKWLCKERNRSSVRV